MAPPQIATVQFFFRCPAELATRFDEAVKVMTPKPSRNAVLVHLVEQWLKEQEQANG